MDLPQYHTRIAAIANPLTPHGTAFALRRHRPHPWTLTHLIANHTLTPNAAGLLSFLVDGHATILIAGSRGAGKTSLLNALILEIPQRFRILTIEDTPEIPTHDFQKLGYKLQSLITKSIATHTTTMELDPTDALRTALRLGESVLIIGEVRGLEAKVLFEAMRIGAAGNLIMGTIHGSTTRDVYERVVYDIGVPPTSFKAVDAVVIAAPIRKDGGIERRRRITQISETAKTEWATTPDPDKVFHDLMCYDTATDTLHATNLMDMGQSIVVSTIAKKWGISIEKALANIHLRAEIKQTLAQQGAAHPSLLEAAATRDANNALWLCIEQARHNDQQNDYEAIKHEWDTWFTRYLRSLT
jgi:type IV secretory pathway ATPase VirB11/archaellum biosynthesis ATPase